MRKRVLYILFFISISSFSQSNWEKFKKLSGSKKTWVFFHVLKAKKALEVSNEANTVTDSIKNSPLLDGDEAGGQVDAFRHTYWMARLRQEIGESAARSLGKAHEKDNYLTYKNRGLEDGLVPDKISSDMDLFNNEFGLSLTRKGSNYPKSGLIYRIINAIHRGKLKIIKKDSKGNFLTCNEKVISVNDLKGKWENKKCLIASNKVIE